MKSKRLIAMSLAATMLVSTLAGCGAEKRTVTGEGEGYGGTITAKVALEGDKIFNLKLTGADETPEIGGRALETLKKAILEAGTIEGVDAVSGATYTSEGVFDAVYAALGIERPKEEGPEVLPFTDENTVNGEAEGYEGTITAKVAVEDGKIVNLELTGNDETPEIGGRALETLKKAILVAGTVEGVDAVSGATYTSEGVFAAINAAMGIETKDEEPIEVRPFTEENTVYGEAEGYYEGIVVAKVAVEDGKIVNLELTGDDETPEIGGRALEKLQKAILVAGTIEGVDAVSGATYTSNGVFGAIKNAMGTNS